MGSIKGKRSTRRAQITRIVNEASATLQSSTYDSVKHTILPDRLLTSNEDLRKTNEELHPLVPVDNIESWFASIAQYGDEAISGLSELNY